MPSPTPRQLSCTMLKATVYCAQASQLLTTMEGTIYVCRHASTVCRYVSLHVYIYIYRCCQCVRMCGCWCCMCIKSDLIARTSLLLWFASVSFLVGRSVSPSLSLSTPLLFMSTEICALPRWWGSSRSTALRSERSWPRPQRIDCRWLAA